MTVAYDPAAVHFVEMHLFNEEYVMFPKQHRPCWLCNASPSECCCWPEMSWSKLLMLFQYCWIVSAVLLLTNLWNECLSQFSFLQIVLFRSALFGWKIWYCWLWKQYLDYLWWWFVLLWLLILSRVAEIIFWTWQLYQFLIAVLLFSRNLWFLIDLTFLNLRFASLVFCSFVPTRL